MQAVAGRERMEIAGDVEAQREPEDVALTEPSARFLGWVALEDREVLLQHLRHWPVRDPLAVGEAAADPPQRARLFVGELLPELPHQPRLAEPRVAEHGDEHRPRLLDAAPVGGLESCELGVASDERTREAADAPRTHQGERPHERPAADAAALALRLDCLLVAELECAARRRSGALAD